MANYQEFLDGIDRAAYHEGELTWEEDGFTVTRTYQYSPPGCHDSCGVLFYAKDGKLDHVEGDPLSPFTNGKLCMRCLDLPEIVNHPDRVLYPMKRAGERGENKWQRISWDDAFTRIAKLMKEDRDANYIAQNAEGVTVNRWLSTGMLCASASSNETGYLTQKFSRALGMLAVDNQARV